MSLRGGKTHPSGKKIVFPIFEAKPLKEIEEVMCARCKNSFKKDRTVEEGGFILCLLCAGEFNNQEAQDSKPQVDETRPTHKGVCSNCGKSVYIDKNSLCYKCRGGTAE